MSVVALFRYEVRPGRHDDFMAKLGEAASAKFDSPVMPRSVRLLRDARDDAGTLTLMIEYDDIAAYDARTAFETGNAEWVALFAPRDDAPERLASVELLIDA